MQDLLKQYDHFKSKRPNAVIILKAGDFYETFRADADTLSQICGLTITYKCGIKLAGFPSPSLDSYLIKIIKAGFAVGVCEQVVNPTKTKIKRDVVRVTSQSIIEC